MYKVMQAIIEAIYFFFDIALQFLVLEVSEEAPDK